MFLGTYESVINEKKRMTLPSKLVKHLTKKQLVIGKGFEECINGFALDTWEKQTQEYLTAPLLDKNARSVRRFVFSNSVIIPYDNQSRIVIPPFLVEYAKIDKEIAIIGSGDHFEIWDRATWYKYEKTLSSV
jgi:MraZ protein